MENGTKKDTSIFILEGISELGTYFIPHIYFIRHYEHKNSIITHVRYIFAI